MKIYLAGAMSGLTMDEMNNWRKAASDELNKLHINNVNPVDFYNFELDQTSFTDKECMKFDLTAVRNSDLILVNLYYNSIGTAIELFEANRLHIPVIGFNANKNTHPWIKECVDTFCDDLYSAIDYIEKYYNKILRKD